MSEINSAQMSGGPSNEKNYWRSLQELADTDEYRSQLENEFPAGIEEPSDGLTRRRFLQVMSASIAVGGTSWLYLSSVPFDQLGFRTDLGTLTYPDFTREFLYAVPLVFLLGPPLLYGLHQLAGRNGDDHTEGGHS